MASLLNGLTNANDIYTIHLSHCIQGDISKKLSYLYA